MQLSEEESRQLADALQDKRIAGEDESALVTWIGNRYRIAKNEARAIYDSFNGGFQQGADAAMNAIKTGGAEAEPPASADTVFRAAYRVGQRSFKLEFADAQRRKGGANQFTGLQITGLFIFIGLCGLPALELTGFGFGISLTLKLALICSIVGGVVGGALICPKPIIAGVIGGLFAGPAGLLAVYYFTQGREQISNVELMFVQGIASLPGFGIGYLLKKWLKPAAD